MDEIELVIKIPKNTYRQIQALARNNYFEHDICGNSMRRIANGIPLPKGHGRIGDLTKLYNEIDARNKGKDKGKYTGILALVGFANTIIEADKEVENDNN